jgi:hypothetical protein
VSKLENRVVAAAESLLARTKFVAPLEVLGAIGWLPRNQVERWQQGRADSVEDLLTAKHETVAAALRTVRRWAEANGLEPSEAEYVAATRDRGPLRFSRAGDEELELLFRTHWVAPGLSEARRRQVEAKRTRVPDLVVVEPAGPVVCADCGGTAELVVEETDHRLCLTCADLDHLVFLPAGNATLTRRATAASGLSAVVLRFERARKRHRRLGVLVEEPALESAERTCLADADVRERRRERDRERRAHQDVDFQSALAQRVVAMFPGCPVDRAEAIALHTGTRGSGRVGRSAAGRALDERAVRLAVVASVRHEDTGYDAMLMRGVPRDEARRRITDDVDRVLAGWGG